MKMDFGAIGVTERWGGLDVVQVPNLGIYVPKPPELSLTAAVRAVTVELKGRTPLTFLLTGPADLRFASFTLAVSAQTLMRNLNDGTHKVAISPPSTGTGHEYRFPEPTYVEEVRLAASGTVTAVWPGGSETTTLKASSGNNFPCGIAVSAIRVTSYSGGKQSVVLRSPSNAAQVLLTLDEGTPLHSFPVIFDPGQLTTATTRDLADVLNKAWPQSNGSLALTLLSQTDGKLRLTAGGAWQRTATGLRPADASTTEAGPELKLTVHPFAPAEAEISLGANWKKATVTVTADGTCRGGLTTRLQPAAMGRRFAVRVTETLQIAQAFRLRTSGGGRTLPALQITGVWLCLPTVPAEEQRVELRLTRTTAEMDPDPTPLVSWQAKLPADASAYLQVDGDIWFRAAAPKPIQIDGSLASERLFLIASGQGEGTPLSHQRLTTKLYPVTLDDLGELQQPENQVQLPTDPPGRALEGGSRVSNLAVDRSWVHQSFDCHNALWRFELELAPDQPAAPLLSATLEGAQPLTAMVPEGLAPEGAVFIWKLSNPGTSPLIRVRARAPGMVSLRLLAEEV